MQDNSQCNAVKPISLQSLTMQRRVFNAPQARAHMGGGAISLVELQDNALQDNSQYDAVKTMQCVAFTAIQARALMGGASHQ